MWSGDDIYFMKLALEEAEKADSLDEVPVGAVIVNEGCLLGRGHNHPVKLNDPTAHAEVLALRSAGAWTKNYRMTGATLYVTLEPCLMCFGALIHARVGRVVRMPVAWWIMERAAMIPYPSYPNAESSGPASMRALT